MAYKKYSQYTSQKSFNNGVKTASFIYGLIDGVRQEKESKNKERNKGRRSDLSK